MRAEYQMTLHSQMGPREGTLTLEREGEELRGILRLVGYENPVVGRRLPDGRLILNHSLQTALGEYLCRSELRLSGEELAGTAELAGCRMRWSGTRAMGPLDREADRE